MSWLLAFKLVWVCALAGLLFISSVASFLRLLLRRLSTVGARKVFPPEAGHRIQADRERVGLSISALHGAAMALFAVGTTGLLTFIRPEHLWENLTEALLIVLGAVALADQLIPFRVLARHDEPEVILARWMPLLRVAVFLALPFTFPVLVSTTIARFLEPAEAEPLEPSPQEEMQGLIEVGEKEGFIENDEGKMLQSVVEFSDKVVREVMTPRPKIAALEINSPVEELRRILLENRHTRYPVYSGQLDHVEGVVSVRDLMELPPEQQAKASLRALVRPVVFTPETKPIRDLLKDLQKSTVQMAIVIDEYGNLAGLVTVEDLVEEIVGEIRDEGETRGEEIVRESEHSYIVAGHTELSRLTERIQVNMEAADYSTVAGLIVAQLGRVPSPGERVEKDGVSIEVLESNPRTVLKVRLRLTPPASTPGPDNAEPRPV